VYNDKRIKTSIRWVVMLFFQLGKT